MTVTRLTLRMLAGDPDFELLSIDEAESQPFVNQDYISASGEPIALKNWLVKAWRTSPSEILIVALDNSFKAKTAAKDKTATSDTASNIYSELQLLNALAREKNLCSSLDETEAAYYSCLSGEFQRVLINNNLGVTHAKKQECKQALERLAEAIKESLGEDLRLKAPFYNFALILEHLDQQRLIFRSNYLETLESISNLISLWKRGAIKQKEVEDYEYTSNKDNWSMQEIRSAYKEIAEYAYNFEPPDDEFFASKLLFLIPERDLLNSFGDVQDKIDRQTAYQVLRKGLRLAKAGKFSDGINALEMAGKFDPEMTFRLTEEIEQVIGDWRKQENQNILKLIEENQYDKAIKALQYMLDQRLQSRQDSELIRNIQKQKHATLLQQADELAGNGEKQEAKLLYKLLLREELDADVRKYVSSKLAELMK